MSPPCVKPRRV